MTACSPEAAQCASAACLHHRCYCCCPALRFRCPAGLSRLRVLGAAAVLDFHWCRCWQRAQSCGGHSEAAMAAHRPCWQSAPCRSLLLCASARQAENGCLLHYDSCFLMSARAWPRTGCLRDAPFLNVRCLAHLSACPALCGATTQTSRLCAQRDACAAVVGRYTAALARCKVPGPPPPLPAQPCRRSVPHCGLGCRSTGCLHFLLVELQGRQQKVRCAGEAPGKVRCHQDWQD